MMMTRNLLLALEENQVTLARQLVCVLNYKSALKIYKHEKKYLYKMHYVDQNHLYLEWILC